MGIRKIEDEIDLKEAMKKKAAELKMKDLNAIDLQGAIRMVEGTARSMGIEVGE